MSPDIPNSSDRSRLRAMTPVAHATTAEVSAASGPAVRRRSKTPPRVKKYAESPWMHGAAGVLGGSLAMVTFYPLDFLRTRMHTLHQGSRAAPLRSAHEIVRQEGLRGMYRGMCVSVVSHSLGWGLYLLTFRSAQKRLDDALNLHGASMNESQRDFLAACAAASITGTVITPLHVIKTRRQLAERGTNCNASVRSIARKEGWASLFRGVGPQVLLTGNTCIQVTIYEWFRRNCFTNKEDPSSIQVALASAFSKAVASALFNPLEVVRTRLQDQRNRVSAEYSSMRAGLQTIWRREGLTGLYRGLPVNVMRVIPSTVMAFVLYEKCLWAIRSSYNIIVAGLTGPAMAYGGTQKPQPQVA